MNSTIKIICSIYLLFSIGSCTIKKENTKITEIKKPNIVYILADDLGYGDISFNGLEKFTTPNID